MPRTRVSESFLFVYGTLRRDSDHPMARFLARHARFVETADFQGRLFIVADYPGAVPSDDPRDRVRGDVFELRRPAWLLRKLDEYEGCRPLERTPAYVRALRPVTLTSGEQRNAWIYLFNRPTRHLQHVVSGDFYAHD